MFVPCWLKMTDTKRKKKTFLSVRNTNIYLCDDILKDKTNFRRLRSSKSESDFKPGRTGFSTRYTYRLRDFEKIVKSHKMYHVLLCYSWHADFVLIALRKCERVSVNNTHTPDIRCYYYYDYRYHYNGIYPDKKTTRGAIGGEGAVT